jgi:photosystem II stability/assembly factor-like uncharacterized protein
MNGFLQGGSNYILRTTNGGINWFQQPHGINNANMTPIYFLNVSTGFSCNYERFYRTTNSGVNWTMQIFGSDINDICFPDVSVGYLACSNGIVYKTTNIGLN